MRHLVLDLGKAAVSRPAAICVTLVLWILAGAAFGRYLEEFSTAYVTTYAGLASAMVALVFLYWTAGIIGRRGLSAPGENITSLGTNGSPQTFGGTSAAAPFVTGAIALLWSEFPSATAGEIKLAVTQAGTLRRRSVAPPVLDAWAAYQAMASAHSGRRAS